MRVAIIGAGLSGLTCSLELEKNGIIPDIYDMDNSIGWALPTVSFWPSNFYLRFGEDIREHLKNTYDIDVRPISKCREIIMKSSNQKVTIHGDLGYFVSRGKGSDSLENQLYRQCNKTAIKFNTPVDYKLLSKSYDWVIIASGGYKEAKKLNVWEDTETVRIIGAIIVGDLKQDSASIYFNTKYAGIGYGRLSPFNSNQAIAGLYIFDKNEYESETLLRTFLETEGLNKFEIIYSMILPPFSLGRVNKFRIDNILLTGRAAGLTESLLGTGGVESMISGVLAAKSIINNEDYESLVIPLQKHIDNISSFRTALKDFDNDKFDKLLSFIDTVGIKQSLYNSHINFSDLTGSILKKILK